MKEAIRIIITGDFCPINRTEDVLSKVKVENIFNDVLPIIRSSDIAVTNLECPLIENGGPIEKYGTALKASTQVINTLSSAGFNLVTLANNHIMDYGTAGLKSTINACMEKAINYLGAGNSYNEARIPYYQSIRGKRFAFLNFAENEFSTTDGDQSGANPLNPISNYYDIKQAKNESDFVFVIVHGGCEYYQLPSPTIKERYRFFVEAGASAVIAHHSHCISGYELYNDAPIFYGIGNFIFDNPKNKGSNWNEGIAIKFIIEENLKFEILPFIQSSEEVGINLMKGMAKNEFENKFKELSGIISDDNLLQHYWDNLLSTKELNYKAAFFIRNKLLRKLFNRKLLPKIFLRKNKSYINLVYNLIRCETHREILIKTLGNK